MEFINLTQCIAQNLTQFEQAECVAKQPVILIGISGVIIFLLLFWFIFGIAKEIRKGHYLIGQGNYWVQFIAIILSIVLWIFLTYQPYWLAWFS